MSGHMIWFLVNPWSFKMFITFYVSDNRASKLQSYVSLWNMYVLNILCQPSVLSSHMTGFNEFQRWAIIEDRPSDISDLNHNLPSSCRIESRKRANAPCPDISACSSKSSSSSAKENWCAIFWNNICLNILGCQTGEKFEKHFHDNQNFFQYTSCAF